MKQPFKITYDPIFGERIEFLNNITKFPNCKWGLISSIERKCLNPKNPKDNLSIYYCETCPLFEPKPNLDIERVISQSSYTNKCLPSFFLIILLFFIGLNLLFVKSSIFSFSYIKTFIGITLSSFGILLSVSDMFISLRKFIKNKEKKLKDNVRSSIIWEYIIWNKQDIEVYCLLIGFLIILIFITFFINRDFQSLTFHLAEKYNIVRYLKILAIIAIILLFGMMWFANLLGKILFWILYSIIFIPRTIFWSIMYTSSYLYKKTNNLKTTRIVGGCMSILGVIILAV